MLSLTIVHILANIIVIFVSLVRNIRVYCQKRKIDKLRKNAKDQASKQLQAKSASKYLQ